MKIESAEKFFSILSWADDDEHSIRLIEHRDNSIEDATAERIANSIQYGQKELDPFMQEIANNFANAIRSGE